MRTVRHLFALFALLALVVPFNLAQPAMAAGPTVTPGSASQEELISTRFRSFGNTGGDEIYVGVPNLGDPPRAARTITWATGLNAITIVYDQNAPSLTAKVVNVNGTFLLTNTNLLADLATKGKTHTLADLNIMQITVASRDLGTQTAPGTSTALKNVVLDGAPLGDFNGTPNVLDWKVTGAQLNDGFTLTGDIVLSGSFSTSQENSKVEIKAGYAAPTVGISASDTTICVGAPTTINVNFANVSNLYGYELKVNYPPAGFTAAGAFVNSWFDTINNAYIPSAWNAIDTSGEIKFAASKQAPAGPVSDSGTVAHVTLTATTAGVYDITLSDVLLGDRDGNQITATAAPTTVTVAVCGFATVTGKVNLQGRGTPPTGTIPPTGGTVTMLDAGYGAYSATFDASGNFTITGVKVAPVVGTTYTISATHGLYLSNITTTLLMPLDNVTLQPTRLKGGDANNDRIIGVGDLALVAGEFGNSFALPGSNADINADGKVNILDLVLPGGNLDMTAPQAW